MSMEKLTLSDLAAIAAPNADADLCARRLKNWTDLGLIKTAGRLHMGTGKHRLYEPEAAYRAAVLMGFSALTVGALEFLSESLDREPTLSAVKEAMISPEPAFLTLEYNNGPGKVAVYHADAFRFYVSSGKGNARAFVNLTRLFLDVTHRLEARRVAA